jgi:hypothetical protein
LDELVDETALMTFPQHHKKLLNPYYIPKPIHLRYG